MTYFFSLSLQWSLESLSRERNLDAQLCRDLNPAARDNSGQALVHSTTAELTNAIANVTL